MRRMFNLCVAYKFQFQQLVATISYLPEKKHGLSTRRKRKKYLTNTNTQATNNNKNVVVMIYGYRRIE